MDSTDSLDGYHGAWLVVLDHPDQLYQYSYAAWPHGSPLSSGAWDGGSLDPWGQAAGRGKHGVCPHGACLWTHTIHDPCRQSALADPDGSLAGWDRSDGPGTGDREALLAPQEGCLWGGFPQDNAVSSHTVTWRSGAAERLRDTLRPAPMAGSKPG